MWNYDTEEAKPEVAEVIEEEVEEVGVKKKRKKTPKIPKKKYEYIATKGLTFDKLGLRIRAGMWVPSDALDSLDPGVFDWLLNKKKAIKKI